MNKKGFTLIELLGVIVILASIVLIAIPSISSSLEKNKNNINDKKKEQLISAAETYMNIKKCDYNITCNISLNTLINEDIIYENEMKDSNNNLFDIHIKYDKTTKKFTIENGTIDTSTCTCKN